MAEQDEARPSGSVALVHDLDTIRALANAARPGTPELGQRTPQPTVTRWTRGGLTDLAIGDVQSILTAGEQGQTQPLVDLWLRMLKTDAHLASVWHSRVSPVASARWELSPGDGPAHTADAARRLRDACEESLRTLGNLEPLFTRLLGGLGAGFAVAEVVWGRAQLLDVGAWSPSKIKPVHGRRFAFSDEFEIGLWDQSQAVSRLKSDGYDVEVISGRGGVMSRLPAGKFLVHQPPTIDDYPTATGLVHPLARWWWAKQKVIVYWLGGAEIAANPRLIGKLLQNAPAGVAEDLITGLEKLAADGVTILRHGTEVEIVPGQGESSASVWSELAKFMDAAMSKVVLGSTLNVEIGDTGGAYAAAESQSDTTIAPRQQQDGTQLWATIRDQLFRWIRDYNPHLFTPDTPLPVGAFVWSEPPVEIDQPLIDSEAVSYDELRISRGLSPWGGAQGEAIVRGAQPNWGAEPAAPEAVESTAPEGLGIDAGVDVQASALNGAQVSALLEIVAQVTQGLLPRQTAVEIIVSAFPIDRAQADRILGAVGAGFVPAVEPVASPAPEVAVSVPPFPQTPWDLARARARALLPGSGATQISLPWPTTPSERERST